MYEREKEIERKLESRYFILKQNLIINNNYFMRNRE